MPETTISRIMSQRRAVRGTYTAVQKFGTCEKCKSLSVYGHCIRCGFARICAWCGKTRQPDGTYRKTHISAHRSSSHGICDECKAGQIQITYPAIGALDRAVEEIQAAENTGGKRV